jgi:mono/diheme cytochrome c family protein
MTDGILSSEYNHPGRSIVTWWAGSRMQSIAGLSLNRTSNLKTSFSFLALLTFLACGLAVSAQQSNTTSAYASGPDTTQKLMSLTPSQREGAYLFKQRCNLCHGPTSMSGFKPYGGRLTKDMVEEHEDVVRKVIMDGTPRMPGFRYGLSASQINMVVEYMKTLEKPTTDVKGQKDNAVD